MIKNVSKNKVLADKYLVANSLFKQVLGLMFRKQKVSLLFNFSMENNRSFHTCFMKYSIDVLFLDSDKKVAKIVRSVKPWKLSITGRAKYVIELPSGKSLNTKIGDKINFK